MLKGELLDKAKAIVEGDRAKDYGSVKDMARDIAIGWSVITGCTITPEQTMLCMDWLKTVRLVRSPSHTDSVIDKAGYAACYAELLDSVR